MAREARTPQTPSTRATSGAVTTPARSPVTTRGQIGRADSRSEAAHVTAYLVDVAGAVEAGGRGHDGRLHGRLGARMSAVSRTHSSEAGQPESWAAGATPLG
ncbi:hypothetical protein HPB47_006545 [Ixodes persulcatus]|uniref:Uncharacterized protein n=1 Tax=Ixodes persulcatus TaxID=34615 RepID=A0AC60PA65_IXOPE|nr:hypothetical protein HPB47_006545 [Ixodes persulcatus]